MVNFWSILLILKKEYGVSFNEIKTLSIGPTQCLTPNLSKILGTSQFLALGTFRVTNCSFHLASTLVVYFLHDQQSYLMKPWTLDDPHPTFLFLETSTFMMLWNLCSFSSKVISNYHFHLLLVEMLEMVKIVAQKHFGHVASIGIHEA
jgi:hypothetical protein